MKRRRENEADGEARLVIGVLVVARSVVMRAGLEALISTDPVLDIVGSTANTDLSFQIEQYRPDVVLWEWSDQEEAFPGLVTVKGFQPAIVLLIDDLSDSAITEFLRAGVRAILPSEATADEMIGAITAAATGLTVLHPDITDVLLPTLSARSLPDKPPQTLTPREIEVLGMLAEGLSNKTIARRLILSEHTVKFHISSLFSKLNVSSRTEAVILGARQGLILL